MARANSVLSKLPITAVIFIVAIASGYGVGRAAAQCPSDLSTTAPKNLEAEIQNIQQAVQSGPFYQELVSKVGKPEACEISLDDGNVKLSYAFRGQGRLRATVNPDAEFTEQKLEYRAITEERALTLLKEAEKALFGENGCGIEWKRPAEEPSAEVVGSRSTVYEGHACNCKARKSYEGADIVALGLSGAC